MFFETMTAGARTYPQTPPLRLLSIVLLFAATARGRLIHRHHRCVCLVQWIVGASGPSLKQIDYAPGSVSQRTKLTRKTYTKTNFDCLGRLENVHVDWKWKMLSMKLFGLRLHKADKLGVTKAAVQAWAETLTHTWHTMVQNHRFPPRRLGLRVGSYASLLRPDWIRTVRKSGTASSSSNRRKKKVRSWKEWLLPNTKGPRRCKRPGTVGGTQGIQCSCIAWQAQQKAQRAQNRKQREARGSALRLPCRKLMIRHCTLPTQRYFLKVTACFWTSGEAWKSLAPK